MAILRRDHACGVRSDGVVMEGCSSGCGDRPGGAGVEPRRARRPDSPRRHSQERTQNSVVHRRQRYWVQRPALLAKSRPNGRTSTLGHCGQTRSAKGGALGARSRQRPGAHHGAQHVQHAGQTSDAPVAGSEHTFGLARGPR
jgi:hypothetical protein